ncbi:alpha/beta hydrolase [Mycolicibacterium phocaicum]|uniref:alpha/beta hydrolase n=1 Tax=Mycolicibacterium phocaicum TaxID=319706 RepID=UPI00092C4183|nr:alpha/beta hydrolase [Mycolicibacterium phocaicum]UCZ58378.1 alpha/beta hydrolase [Mycolicibacterium phocaicum]SHW78973.1 esterase/lipase [Mycobacteroides abscessus subsp. abscessus]
MSILARPVVADAVARLFSSTINPAPKPGVRFPEIPGNTTSVVIPTRHGDTAATVYWPEPSDGAAGVYVNVHGGGFVVGHREQDDPWCRFLAAHANVVVVNPDYVLAPGHRFPAPVEQVYDVLVWASAAEREWDGSKLCVGGQSAGGSLSAAAARLALEQGGPEIKLQMLHYAPLDLVTASSDKHSPLGAKAIMRPWMSEVFDTAYIPDPVQRRDRLASPAWGNNADGIGGIAPALIVTAEYDRLRDEAWRYAQKLDAVGALAEYHEVSGVDHGYNIMSSATDVTRGVYELIAGHVSRAIAG